MLGNSYRKPEAVTTSCAPAHVTAGVSSISLSTPTARCRIHFSCRNRLYYCRTGSASQNSSQILPRWSVEKFGPVQLLAIYLHTKMASPPNITPNELASLPPSILNNLPALQPPAGVESNFNDPVNRAFILNSVATVMFCFMVCLFANRAYTKVFVIRKATWDDCKCACKDTERIKTWLIAVRSNMHNWICRYSGAVSA